MRKSSSRHWVSWVPFGFGYTKPHHYLKMARVAWENRDNLPYALRILRHGVCDGCALGTTGLKDWTIDGVHLCMVRLELMRLNTAPALGPGGKSLVALVAAADGTLQLETLDLHGHTVATQALGVRTTGAVSVRWDLAHARVVLLQAGVAGGIDARVLLLDDASATRQARP